MPSVGAILMGAILGLGLGIVGAIPFLTIGWDTSTVAGQISLILVGVVAQFAAGYAAARVGERDHELHGGLAALLLFAVVAAISLAAARDPSVVTLAAGGMIALMMGTLGGLLAHSRTE